MREDYTFIPPGTADWKPHPRFTGVAMAHLVSPATDELDMLCALVRLPAGSHPDRHVHPASDDILYVLEGRAMMWIEGLGEVPLEPGTFLRISKGVAHQPVRIEADLLLYDVWYPADPRPAARGGNQ